jgi:hypothetical protein
VGHGIELNFDHGHVAGVWRRNHLRSLFASSLGRQIMLVFLDLGDKRDVEDRTVCVAAAIFKPKRYRHFVQSWNKFLRNWDATAFHAADFYPGAGEFERLTDTKKALFENDARRLPALIGSHITRLIVVSFRPDEFNSAVPDWKSRYAVSLHALAVQLCINHIGIWASQNHPRESFAYVMESGDLDERDVLKNVKRMTNNAEVQKYTRVTSFAISPKGVATGVEVADFVAWHWNKFYMDKFRFGNDVPRKDFAALIEITKEKVASAFLTGQKLKEFLTIAPLTPLLEKSAHLDLDAD